MEHISKITPAVLASLSSSETNPTLADMKAPTAERVGSKYIRELCPRIFRENDTSRFPDVWSDLQGWQGRSHHLGIVGPTGRCKTRMVWQLILEWSPPARMTCAVTGTSLARAIQHQWSDENAKETVKLARSGSLLFIDDLGKQKLTPAVEEEIFDLFDHRFAHEKPLMFTTNLTGEELKRSLSPNFSAAMMRRLGEFCEIHTVA